MPLPSLVKHFRFVNTSSSWLFVYNPVDQGSLIAVKMKLVSTTVGLAAVALVAAQIRTATTSLEVTGTATQTISSLLTASAAPTGEACAAVSSILADQYRCTYPRSFH